MSKILIMVGETSADQLKCNVATVYTLKSINHV